MIVVEDISGGDRVIFQFLEDIIQTSPPVHLSTIGVDTDTGVVATIFLGPATILTMATGMASSTGPGAAPRT